MRFNRVFLAALALLAASLGLLFGPTAIAEKNKTTQPDLACFEPELPHQLGRRTVVEVPDYLVAPASLRSESAAYDMIRYPVSFLSAPGVDPFIHGRQDVLANSDLIRRFAVKDMELIVAATIAHQASDAKDRPFGADAVETFWIENVDPDASVGIAQLRASEVVYWAPELVGADLLDPEVAVRVMTAKLEKANRYISRADPDTSITDRTMLLALVQNDSSEIAMRNTLNAFFVTARQDWTTMLSLDEAKSRDWMEQLRLVLVQYDWLVSQGWEKPAGIDRDFWARTAFPRASKTTEH
ncbi:MAG: hypothetical protein M9927_10530 [Anaerolineae bacterium]|nr:hypothetical protein [Anaerolineae bacterium]